MPLPSLFFSTASNLKSSSESHALFYFAMILLIAELPDDMWTHNIIKN